MKPTLVSTELQKFLAWTCQNQLIGYSTYFLKKGVE
jgi:hypothetical protein